MEIQLIILVLTFISIVCEYYSLLGIDLEINGKSFPIKNDEEYVKTVMYKNHFIRGSIPKKYLDLIKQNLIENKYKCKKRLFYSGGLYETFYCPKKNSDYSSIKLNFKLNTTSVSLTEKELFETKGDDYHINFKTDSKMNILIIPTKLLNRNDTNTN